eukprot:5771336-Pyramimonas_sp.AAC.1
MTRLCRIGQKLGSCVASSVLKTLCNAWATSRRFRAGRAGCRFGCYAVGGDDILHYFACPNLVPRVRECLPRLPPCWGTDPISSFVLALVPLIDSDCLLSV